MTQTSKVLTVNNSLYLDYEISFAKTISLHMSLLWPQTLIRSGARRPQQPTWPPDCHGTLPIHTGSVQNPGSQKKWITNCKGFHLFPCLIFIKVMCSWKHTHLQKHVLRLKFRFADESCHLLVRKDKYLTLKNPLKSPNYAIWISDT